MLRKRNNQKFLSTVLAVAYLFVALFSQNFHQHDSGTIFKDFNFKKSEKSYSENHHAAANSDCLSCHFLHDGHALVLEQANADFLSALYFSADFFSGQSENFSQNPVYFHRRGPPTNFS